MTSAGSPRVSVTDSTFASRSPARNARRLRVLITTATLRSRSGTTLYVRDLALELQRQGHEPAVYTLSSGELAAELRAAGIPVLTSLSPGWDDPDIIHAHHYLPTLTALGRYRTTPAIHVCHDHLNWLDRTPAQARVRRHFAVSNVCRERVASEGIPRGDVDLLLNWVDMRRFTRRAPLPDRPERAVVFSNAARADTHLPAVQEACRRAGIRLDVIGVAAGRPSRVPERQLGDYDLVFAKARSALEAMAVGCAVILCDYAGSGPMVTTANFDGLRPQNFGFEALQFPLEPDYLLGQVARYDARDATAVSDRVRGSCDLHSAAERLVAIYSDVVESYRQVVHDVTRREPDLDLAGIARRVRLYRLYVWLYSGLETPLGAWLKRVPGWGVLRFFNRSVWRRLEFKGSERR